MKKYLKIALFGFLIWLIVFLISIALFSIHETQRPLFESIMPVVITACVVFFSILHFRKTEANFLKEGVLLGVIWFAVNIFFSICCFS